MFIVARRSVAQRMAAWVMAALLALVVGEPLRVHECPMHLRSIVAGDAQHDAAQHDAAQHGAAQHGAAHRDAAHRDAAHRDAAHHDAPDATQPPDHQGGCDCLGTCCTVAPVGTPRVAAVRTSVVRVVAPSIRARAPLAPVPAGEHVLPFALAPPSLA